METKRVKAEIVGLEKKSGNFWKKLKKVMSRVKLIIAVILDVIDFAIAWIPIVNSAWDVVSFLILLLILKNKRLAFVSLVELPLIGLPPFSIIDMFLPICTITVLMDNQESNL